MLRHGQAHSNVQEIMSSFPETFDNPLTDKGVKMAKEAAKILQTKNIDAIFASDVLRAKQTAEIVAQTLGLTVTFDQRLREIDFGSFNGKNIRELEGIVDGSPIDTTELKRRIKPGGKMIGYAFAGGEDYPDIAKRMYNFLQDIEKKYEGKIIVIVSHQSPLCLLEEKVKDIEVMQISKTIPGYVQIHTGEVRELTAEYNKITKSELQELKPV